MLATEVVHTTGINWESLGVIVAALAFAFGIVTWRQTQSDKRQREQKEEITTSVDNLKDVLLEKLETKENVNQIRVDMAGLKSDVEHMRQTMNHAH